VDTASLTDMSFSVDYDSHLYLKNKLIDHWEDLTTKATVGDRHHVIMHIIIQRWVVCTKFNPVPPQSLVLVVGKGIWEGSGQKKCSIAFSSS